MSKVSKVDDDRFEGLDPDKYKRKVAEEVIRRLLKDYLNDP
jgi:hypothetical protein